MNGGKISLRVSWIGKWGFAVEFMVGIEVSRVIFLDIAGSGEAVDLSG